VKKSAAGLDGFEQMKGRMERPEPKASSPSREMTMAGGGSARRMRVAAMPMTPRLPAFAVDYDA